MAIFQDTQTVATSHTSIRVEEVDAALITEYRMKPVLTVPVLGPVCQQAAVAAMIKRRSGTLVLISICYKTSSDHANKDRASSLSDHLYPDPRRREKNISPRTRTRAASSFDVNLFDKYQRNPWVRILFSRRRRGTF